MVLKDHLLYTSKFIWLMVFLQTTCIVSLKVSLRHCCIFGLIHLIEVSHFQSEETSKWLIILCVNKHPLMSLLAIEKDLSYWKASELQSWLLFYSLPLVLHVLPPLYFHHFALLVCAMHILLSKEITDMECGAAEEMLQDFCMFLPELYGIRNCTMNAHSLLHLPYYVRLWGPCWAYSAFSFESHNGDLKHSFDSNRQVADQLSDYINVRLMLQKVSHEIEYRESEDCLKFLKFDRHHSRSMTNLKHGYAVGEVTIKC